MPAARLTAPPEARDPAVEPARFGTLEPVRPRRAGGAIHDSPGLGRLEFVRMPPGQASFWFGQRHMPDSPFGLQIVCEVDDDELPTPAHVANVVALRRNQVNDALACVPLINARLRAMNLPCRVHEEDLALTAIYLRPHPLLDPCHELEYHVSAAPELVVTVAFVRGTPRTVHVERDNPLSAL